MATRIKIFIDGEDTGYYLPDISYELFTKYIFVSGSSDTEYAAYLRENKMCELDHFGGPNEQDFTLVYETWDGEIWRFQSLPSVG
jgi:hypothetical protein